MSLSDLRRLPCPHCGSPSDLLLWLDHARGARPADHCVEVACPSCGSELELELRPGVAAIGGPGPGPRAGFHPDARVEQPGLESDLKPEGWIVRLLHRQWVFAPARAR